MSDETNGNRRLDRIEEDIVAIASNIRELTALSLRNEFNLAQYRQANDERAKASDEHAKASDARAKANDEYAKASAAMQAKTQEHLDYLTQLAGIFADRTVVLEDKAKRVKEVL